MCERAGWKVVVEVAGFLLAYACVRASVRMCVNVYVRVCVFQEVLGGGALDRPRRKHVSAL